MSFALLFSLLSVAFCAFTAGFSKVDITLPVGVPLAGYDDGDRVTATWPLPSFSTYGTWMNPSTDIIDSQYAKVLILDDGTTKAVFVSLDLFLADSTLAEASYVYARADGFTVPFENIVFCGSHTHSGPAAWVPRAGHLLGPSADFFDYTLFASLAKNIGRALVLAQRSYQPVQVAIGMGELIGVTHNRRAGESPYVHSGTIDPNVGLIRVDDLTGKPLVTLWNFAIHGICYDETNMKLSSDIMGYANIDIEKAIGGISMFVNSDAGDINPRVSEVCINGPNFKGSQMIAAKVLEIRESLAANVTTQGIIQTASLTTSFAPVYPNWTFSRTLNCSTGGPLRICSICAFLDCDVNPAFPESWWDSNPRFTAFSFILNNVRTLMATVPGEAIVELGWWIRNDSLKIGFDKTFILGYSNNYLARVTPTWTLYRSSQDNESDFYKKLRKEAANSYFS